MPLKPIKFNDRIKAKEMTPYRAVNVAKMIKKRWPEMEPLILKHPETAFHYAKWVIKDRWPEAEPIILQDYNYANYYAYYILRDRWPELEQRYKEHPNAATYKTYVNLMFNLKKGDPLI